MELSKAAAGIATTGLSVGRVPDRERAQAVSAPVDDVQLGNREDAALSEALTKMGKARGNRESAAGATIKLMNLVDPPASTHAARNRAPVVIVHGTMSDKKSIENFLDPVLQAGHPTDLDTFLTIKEGEALQNSGHLISRDINSDRLTITRENLQQLKACNGDLAQIQDYLQMGSNLYGSRDAAVDKVAALLPGVIERIDGVASKDKEQLLDSFSLQMKQIEGDLAGQVRQSGFGADIKNARKRNDVCDKVAAEIMDSIAPKAVVVGHSMGGFVSYVLAVNPREKADDKSDFSYDAGNGISTVITLSSPVKSGVKVPLPIGLTNYAFDNYEKTVLAPLEGMPGMQFALLNPVFAAWYGFEKETARQVSGMMSDTTTAMTAPMTYMMKPGVQQISEGSQFIHDYVEGKKVPTGITGIAFTNQMDGVSEADRSTMDDSQPNVFNMDAKFELPKELLAKPGYTKPVLAHFLMGKYPLERGEEFKHEVLEKATLIPKVLDRANYDGVRWQCLNTLLGDLQKDPALFQKPGMADALKAVRDVASERMPFKDSPSYVAQQILDELAHKDTGNLRVASAAWALPMFGA